MKICVQTLMAITSMVFLHAGPCAHAQQAQLPGVQVTGTAPEGLLRQESPVGPYNQPWWTTERTFGTSRVYVRPPGTVEFVQFWTPEFKDGMRSVRKWKLVCLTGSNSIFTKTGT
jgi:hypothetical protein